MLIAQSAPLLCATDFWSAKFLTSDRKKNRIESPPAHDPAGNAIAVWERDDTNLLPEVLAARSTDSGSSWTIKNIRSSAVPAGVSDRSPVIVTDKSGVWLCVWSSDDPRSGGAPADYDILFSRSLDAGATWSPPQLLNSTGLNDIGADIKPWVSMDQAGNCVAAWTSDNDLNDESGTTSSQTGIWLSRSSDAGATWTTAEPMTREAGYSLSEPHLATNGEGAFGFVWASRFNQEPVGNVNFSYSGNAGTSWTKSTPVNTGVGLTVPPGEAFNPALTGDPSGKWMISWNTTEVSQFSTRTLACVARTIDNGTNWLSVSKPVTAFHSNDNLDPSLYTDASGVWTLGSSKNYGSATVLVTRNFGGDWSRVEAFPLTAPAYIPGYPEPLESTPFMWRKNETDWTALFGKIPVGVDPVSPNGRFEIRQATTFPPSLPPVNTDWAPAKSFSNDGGVVNGINPRVASNTRNTWISVYTSIQSNGAADTEIAYTRSINGGIDWSAPRVLNSDWQTESSADNSPAISASDSQVWLCAWARSDGGIWLARSLDGGVSWLPPQRVILQGGAQVTGTHPGISSLGDNQWVLVWQNGSIYSSKTRDDGLSWSDPVLVQGTHTINTCGNTTPCSNHSFSAPNVFSVPGDMTTFVGFEHYSTNRPSGYSGPANTYQTTDGHISRNGGESYEGNLIYSYPRGPTYRGTDEMAGDGENNWMSARRSNTGAGWRVTFGMSRDNGNTLTYSSLADVAGRENIWGKVAMDLSGHWFRLWSGRQNTTLGSLTTNIFLSESADYGDTWTPVYRLDTRTSNGADEPVNMDVKGGASGNFVAVWQANSPSGEETIWYSSHNKFANNTAAATDWQLFD